MEIERKYLVHEIPVDLTKYQVKHMEQMYVSVKPVIRIRRTDDRRVLTVKSKGLLSRQEFEMDLDEDEYRNLRCKADGNIIEKDRYIIPLSDTDGTCGDSEVDRELKCSTGYLADSPMLRLNSRRRNLQIHLCRQRGLAGM